MKILLEHALPKKIDYLKVFANLGSAFFYLSVDGRDFQLMGRIGGARRQPSSFTDREYGRYRISHPVDEVLADNGEEVVLRTSDGAEEQWLKPKWLLRRRRALNLRPFGLRGR